MWEPPPLSAPFSERLQSFSDRISALGGRRPVTLVAVSKMQPSDSIRDLYRAGQRDFGENYVQELLEKEARLRADCPDLRWHFIGHLQKNKVQKLIPVVHSIHSVDSVALALAIDKAVEKTNRSSLLPIFLEVNIDAEASKSGIAFDEIRSVTEKIQTECKNLLIMGLMGIPNPSRPSPDAFQKLRKLRDQLGGLTAGKLSMGMSSDFETAIENGSDFVRIGSALFGERKSPHDSAHR
jgi:PLP dependent protein